MTEEAKAASGAFTVIHFSPAAPEGGFADNAAITVRASHIANLAFVRQAIALACVPLELPRGASNADYASMNGMGIRVVYGYDIKSKVDTVSFDLLLGAKVIDPALGVRFMA